MTSYRFEAVVEPDEDQWHAYCPALIEQGGATWGETREEALANLEEVVRLVVCSLLEHGEEVHRIVPSAGTDFLAEDASSHA